MEHVLLGLLQDRGQRLFFAVEVGVEGAGGALGFLRDVRQTRIDEAVALEHGTGSGNEGGASA